MPSKARELINCSLPITTIKLTLYLSVILFFLWVLSCNKQKSNLMLILVPCLPVTFDLFFLTSSHSVVSGQVAAASKNYNLSKTQLMPRRRPQNPEELLELLGRSKMEKYMKERMWDCWKVKRMMKNTVLCVSLRHGCRSTHRTPTPL